MIKLIKSFINTIWNFIGFNTPEPTTQIVEQGELFKPRKKKDTTPFTQEDYDIILQEYDRYLDLKTNFPASHITQEIVTKRLNLRLNLNKSRNAYRRVWEGKVSRESLTSQKRLNM